MVARAREGESALPEGKCRVSRDRKGTWSSSASPGLGRTLPAWGAGGPGIAGIAGVAGIRETLSAVPAASLQKARWLCACMAHARGSVDGRSVRGHGRAFASLGGCGR